MASAALMLAASCNKMEEVNTPVDTPADTTVETPAETETITVQLNPGTKTSLGEEGTATIWSQGDAVDVTTGGTYLGTLCNNSNLETFSGEIKAGTDGGKNITLYYPSCLNGSAPIVPDVQKAVENSFDEGAAVLEGYTTMADLRAGKPVTMENMTALLKFSVAQDGDVTFNVGEDTYTITGCNNTAATYYACIDPQESVALSYKVGDKTGAKSKENATFEAGKIYNLGTLEIAPETTMVYFRPTSATMNKSPYFAAWCWANDEDGSWFGMTDSDDDGIYELEISSLLPNIIFTAQSSEDYNWGDNVLFQTADLKVPTDAKNAFVAYNVSWVTLDEARAFEEPAEVCKLIARVNKQITWYDKYIYSWTAGTSTGNWPGAKMSFVKEDGNYYVYSYDFPYSLNGKKIDYIINGSGGQTKDLSVTLNGQETTVTIEKSHLK